MSRRAMVGFEPDRLVRAREAKRWSQAELALRATTAWRKARGFGPADSRGPGVSAAAVSTWERGISSPQADKLRWVALALGVPMDSLICVPEEERTLGTLRELAGRVMTELAPAAGISTATLAGLERGQSTLTDTVAERLAAELALPAAVVRAAYERSRIR